MKHWWLITLLLFTLPAAAADKVYKKVNPDGSVEFSDQPSEGSEELPLQKAPATRFEKSPGIDIRSSTSRQDDAGGYEVTILSPTNNQSIRDNAGNVTLESEITPSLRRNHQRHWILDGKSLDEREDTIQLSNLDRGSHTLRLEVIDQNGEVQAASASVIFFMIRRSAILQKAPQPDPNAPPTPTNPPKPVIPGPTPTNPPKPTPPSP